MYAKGFCVIRHLGINGTDVTIKSFFTISGIQPAFTIRSYFNNTNQPQFEISNRYFVSKQKRRPVRAHQTCIYLGLKPRANHT
jgi:hypothetical protein